MHIVAFVSWALDVTLVSTCGSLAIGNAAKQTALGKPD